jgi:ribosomal-protein-alanine N-acetyltransferase
MYYFIEPMAEQDIDDVVAIEQASSPVHWSANIYRQELRNSTSSRYIVVRASHLHPPPRHQAPLHACSHTLLHTIISRLLPPPRTTTTRYPIVGYGGLWVGVDEGHITTLAVQPRYRGQGIGELLLNGLIDLAFELHATMLTLEVRVSNTVAQSLYQKYGFVSAGHRPRYYEDNGEDALIMWTIPIQSSEYQERLRELRYHLFNRLSKQAEQTPVVRL